VGDVQYTRPIQARIHQDGMLLCPVCGPGGYGYIHQGVVKNYARGEDDERVVVTTIDGVQSQVGIEASTNANPSSRRQGLTIQFSCETCGATDLELAIAQHKGQTFVTWRRPAGGDWPA